MSSIFVPGQFLYLLKIEIFAFQNEFPVPELWTGQYTVYSTLQLRKMAVAKSAVSGLSNPGGEGGGILLRMTCLKYGPITSPLTGYS
jgi:hypothetical protein